MGRRGYSRDIRELVVGEVLAGGSRRAAARRFKVSASSAIRWADLHDSTGSAGGRPRARKSRSPLEPRAAWLPELVGKEPDLTLAEIEGRLVKGLGAPTTDSSIDRLFKRHKISFKAGQAALDPSKLVFVDETGTSTKRARVRGRRHKGKRLIGKAPFGHWKTTTFTAALRVDGLTAPFVLDGPMNGEAFLAYVEKGWSQPYPRATWS